MKSTSPGPIGSVESTIITSKPPAVCFTKSAPSAITSLSRASSKAPSEMSGRYSFENSTTPASISTIVTSSTEAWFSTARAMPPSPPPMMQTRFASPWAMIGTWDIISW